MKRPRRGRKRKGGKHLTISARNAEWKEARARADRHGLSVARYVRTLLDRDVSGEERTFTALTPEEQRELLEGMRELRSLLTEEAASPAEAEAEAEEEEAICEPRATPAREEETAREPAVTCTPEDAGQAESSEPAEPDGPEPSQGRLPF